MASLNTRVILSTCVVPELLHCKTRREAEPDFSWFPSLKEGNGTSNPHKHLAL